jgi:hypothetical protein
MGCRSAWVLLACVAIAELLMAGPAWSQATQKARFQKAAIDATPWEARRSVFSGNEMRLGAFGTLNSDCSSGSLPDIRLVKSPASGEISFEETRSIVGVRPTHPWRVCNGLQYDTIRMSYKSRDDFVGKDRVIIDIDFKNGNVRRLTLLIDVR